MQISVSIGRIVIYTLHEQDAEQINRRRTTSSSIAERFANNGSEIAQAVNLPETWPVGAQAHIGNSVKAGDQFPMLVTRVWSPSCVNGQVFLDGNDCFWATSATEGVGGHTWAWPQRV